MVVEVFNEQPDFAYPRPCLAMSEVLNSVLRASAIVTPIMANLNGVPQASFDC